MNEASKAALLATRKMPQDARWVILAVAAHLDDDGPNCMPSVDGISELSGVSPRKVRRLLDSAEVQQIIADLREVAR